MVKSRNKQRNMIVEDEHIAIRELPIQPNNHRTTMDGKVDNQTTEIMSNNMGIQKKSIKSRDNEIRIERSANMFEIEKPYGEQRVMDENTKIKSSSSHTFDRVHLHMDTEETSDRRQAIVTIGHADNLPNGPMTRNRRVVEVITEQSNLATTDIISDIERGFNPIVGYAAEPLLPLSEACYPLNKILNDLSFYVQMALDETPREPSDRLTIDESAAIRLYSIEWSKPYPSLYWMLNHTLKSGSRENLRPYFKYMKLLLTALVKLPCVPPITIWRGVTKDLSTQFRPGISTIWWGFSSCTTELLVLKNNQYLGDNGERTLFSVEAINGRTIRAHSHFVNENEILLLPGTQITVRSQFNPAPDLHIIHLQQVIPEEMLLEPPFEGNFDTSNELFQINNTTLFRRSSLSKN